MLGKYQKQREFLKNNFKAENLAHAFLFSGQDIDSIESFTKDFIKLVNCVYSYSHGRENLSIKEKPCGECQNCRMIEGESFPDLLVVRSRDSKSSKDNEKDMMEISVEQIREVQNFLSYKSYYGNFKTIIIENAERMTTQAQNCFLKSLEEPKGKTIIFLVSAKSDFLLPTIFSRCQHVKFFFKNSDEFSESEQKVLDGFKKIMSSDLAEKFNYAKNTYLEEGNFSKILVILQKYFRNLLLVKIGVFKKSKITEEETFTMDKVRKILEMIENLNYQASVHNINQKLALEILLLEL